MVDGAGFHLKNEDGEGQAAGAGIFDTAFQLDKARDREPGEEDWKHDADLGVNGAAVGLDSLALVFDPLGNVIAAGVGWLIEHLGVLREPLDQLMGDPDNIKKIVEETLFLEAEKVKIASEFASGSLKKVSGWEGAAADKYREDIAQLQEEVDTLYQTVKKYGDHMMNTAIAVAATRSTVRDIIAILVGGLVAGALVAAAAAFFTAGASIAAFAAYAVARVASVMATIAGHIATLSGQVSKLMKKVGGTGAASKKVEESLKRYQKHLERVQRRRENKNNQKEDLSPELRKLFDDPQLPKKYGYSTHEALMRDVNNLAKKPDEFLKANLPEPAYKALKGLNDAVDPMKGPTGQMGKEILELAKAASTEDEDRSKAQESAKEGAQEA